MLYKFVGYVCVNIDSFYFIVMLLFEDEDIELLYVVGCLDLDMIGLVLIIDDG